MPESEKEMIDRVDALLKRNKYNVDNPQQSSNIFDAYKNYVDLILERMKSIGPKFALTQGALRAMNPLPPKVYNPATPLIPIGSEGFITDSLDVPVANISPNLELSRQMDIHKQARKGTLPKIRHGVPVGLETKFPNGKNREQMQEDLNIYNKNRPTSQNQVFDNSDPSSIGLNGMKAEVSLGVSYDVPDYSAAFEKRSYGPGFKGFEKGSEFFKPNHQAIKQSSLASKNRVANHDTFFSREDYENGYLTEQQFQDLGGDSAIYVPFFFEDLRKQGRRIYFRAFLTSFRESITPEWSKEKYYGRIDPVAIYKSTERTFQVAFKIASFSPAGYSAMWRKVNHLAKMVYPTYNSNGVISRSPILRVRIGDVMAQGSGQGLPGFISSPLEFDYTDSPWEISPKGGDIDLGMGPMVIKASFSFQVIHQENPSLDENYNFTLDTFRSIGELPPEEAPPLSPAEETNPSTEVSDDTGQDSVPDNSPVETAVA